jgi:hypothetical protein
MREREEDRRNPNGPEVLGQPRLNVTARQEFFGNRHEAEAAEAESLAQTLKRSSNVDGSFHHSAYVVWFLQGVTTSTLPAAF